jgi:hypothetical protein
VDKKFTTIILPYWIQFRMARDDPWDGLSQDDLDFVKRFWHRVFGSAPPYEITRNTDIYKKVCHDHLAAGVCLRFQIVQLKSRLCDYRNRVKAKGEQVALERFKKMYKNDPDAIRDREKRIAFGTHFCDAINQHYRFIWLGYDSAPVSWRCLAP